MICSDHFVLMLIIAFTLGGSIGIMLMSILAIGRNRD